MDPTTFREATKRLHDLNAKAASLKEYLVAMDQRRQDNRVAARGMQKEICQNKLWMSAGDIFLRMPAEEAKAVMKKDDDSIAEEIETARRELLHVQAEMEKIAGSGTAHQVGASLQGMTGAEVNQVLQPWQYVDTEE